MPPASPTSSASRSSTSTSPPTTRTACSPSSCASTRPGERPTPTCCATPRSSSRPSSTTRSGSAPSASRPDTTPACGKAGPGRFELLKGLDGQKDQSYFLHRLSQAQLARTLFPIGELAKTEVRRIAAEIGLPNARKKDSTGICFIGERPFREFLNRYLANTPGPIEDDRGRTIGEHVGLSFYTLGQRKGIGIGGLKDPARRARRRRARALVRRRARTSRATSSTSSPVTTTPGCCRAGSSPTTPAGSPDRRPPTAAMRPRRATARPTRRARCERGAARRTRSSSSSTQPQWAVTPGQSAVVYDGDVCLGGAVIAASDAHNVAPRGAAPTARRIPARRPLTARRA